MKTLRIVHSSILAIFVLLIGCGDGHLRGSVTSSLDGKTYLVVVDDNGGHCGPIIVDGKEWKYKIDEAGLISPGIHTIECGTEIKFEIPQGVVYCFEYWGP